MASNIVPFRRFKKPRRRTRWFHWVVAIVASAGIGHFIGMQSTKNPLLPNYTARTVEDKAIEGRASVIDGDTIEIGGTHIRFDGIDAPESEQDCTYLMKGYQCGQTAAKALAEFLAASRPTRCIQSGTDQYGRVIGSCFRADGEDVSRWLVRHGHALDWPHYSKGRYLPEQQAAQREKAGIWAGEFTEPWEWRHQKRSAEAEGASAVSEARTEPASSSTALLSTANGVIGACQIKGNISPNTGEKIYHLPGQRYYDETRVSLKNGERYFCSEEDAQAAGWRRSRQ